MSRTSTEARGAARKVRLDGPTMGSRWTAVWFDNGRADPIEIGSELVRAVGAVDDQMSTWKPESDLKRLNRARVGDWHDVPTNLAAVLATALRIQRASGGAFDPGVGRLVAEWGFGSHAGQADRLAAPLSTRAIETLQVDAAGRRVRKLAPMSLDLSGIAKGFGVDELARVLGEAGIGSYLVGIDGELRARGRKADGTPWSVAVERPDPAVRAVHGVVVLEDCAIATSGDYRYFRDGDGGRISHTIDPRSGRPARSEVASVTVLAPTAMVADATATALMVLGPEDGFAFAERLGVDCLFILRKGDGSTAELATRRFARTDGEGTLDAAFTDRRGRGRGGIGCGG